MGIFNNGVKKAKKNEMNNTGTIYGANSIDNTSVTLWKNNGIDICAKACAICWDKPIPRTTEDKIKYLANRAKTGHTSIFEHSNFVVYMEIKTTYDDDLIELLDAIRYLETAVVHSNKYRNRRYVLIGGSYAGYLHLYRTIKNPHNNILNRITQQIYANGFEAPFEELINDGILDRSLFADSSAFWCDAESEWTPYIHKNTGNIEVSEHIYVENIDNIVGFCSFLKDICEEYYLFDVMDILRMVSCTVLFKDMSRTATHQLVRHRNAITQESQRYVDYSEACFANPATFKPDKYDKDHKYHIEFGGQSFDMTLEEIGLAEQGIYKWLKNSNLAGEEYHLLKEDARAYLPGNIICRKLYMTFTFKNLIKFLELRENPHAQAEIRLAATELGKWFREYLGNFFNGMDIYEFTKPHYKIDLPNVTDDGEVRNPGKDDSWVENVIAENPEFKEDNK